MIRVSQRIRGRNLTFEKNFNKKSNKYMLVWRFDTQILPDMLNRYILNINCVPFSRMVWLAGFVMTV